MPRTLAALVGEGELEPGEVVARHGQQHVGATLQLGDVGVADQDQEHGHRTQER